jgi:hypothetical protein
LSWGVGIVEHMFDNQDAGIGLWPGERPEDFDREDHLAWSITCSELADGWVEPDRHLLPDGLEDLLPGPYLAAVVHAVDPTRLNGHDAVRVMKAFGRLASGFEAGKLAAVAEVAHSPAGDADSPVERDGFEVEYVEAEIAAALTLTRSAARKLLARALSLQGLLSRVAEAFAAGLVDSAKTRVFDQTLGHLPADTVDTVLDQILDEAEGLTTGQLQARMTRLVLAADPDGAASAFEEGVADRGVVTYPNPDLSGSLLIHNANPKDIAAARSHIENLARSLKTSSEPRTLEQLRADVALDLLQGKCVHQVESNKTGRTNLMVPLTTLAGLSDTPGELEGYGPVIAEIARKTAAENIDGEWTFTVTDQGQPVATGTLSRRPTASQRRHLQALYPTCVFPGCRQPAHDCDLDHRKPFSQGGPTHNDNLGPLCRHHHMVRHHAPWQLLKLANGDHQWTSPLGHTYTRKRAPPE